jgi:hypothetical protein
MRAFMTSISFAVFAGVLADSLLLSRGGHPWHNTDRLDMHVVRPR